MTTIETTGVGDWRDEAISIPLGALQPGLSVSTPGDGSAPVEFETCPKRLEHKWHV